MVISPPIFIVCSNNDVLAFASVSEAEAALESPDVEAGEYIGGFDANGTRLSATVAEPTKQCRILGITSIRLTPVRIIAASNSGDGADELRRRLAATLGDATPDGSLSDLVERACRTLSH